MKKLEYELGNIKLIRCQLKFEGEDPYDAAHLFVVDFLNGKLRIHIHPAGRHSTLASLFKLNEKDLVGGGSCYIDKKNNLILGDYSGDFGSIPEEVAEEFAKKIKEKFGEKYDIKGIKVNPENKLKSFWEEYSKTL